MLQVAARLLTRSASNRSRSGLGRVLRLISLFPVNPQPLGLAQFRLVPPHSRNRGEGREPTCEVRRGLALWVLRKRGQHGFPRMLPAMATHVPRLGFLDRRLAVLASLPSLVPFLALAGSMYFGGSSAFTWLLRSENRCGARDKSNDGFFFWYTR